MTRRQRIALAMYPGQRRRWSRWRIGGMKIVKVMEPIAYSHDFLGAFDP